MIRRIPRGAVALVLLGALCTTALAKEVPTAEPAVKLEVKGRLEVQDGHRVLTVWGTPHERGFAHGYLLAPSILKGIRHDLEKVMRPLLPKFDTMVVKAVAPAFAFAPHEEKELEGILAGIRKRLPPEEVKIAALKRDVTVNDLKALNTFGDWYPLACSSVAVWGDRSPDGTALVGRNFDFPGFELILAHQIIVVRAKDGERHGSVSISYPGCVGATTGMSTQGLFVSIHDVPVKPPMLTAFRKNVPRLVAVRRLFEQVSGDKPLETAQELVRTWPSLYGNNLMVAGGDAKGDAARAGVLETDFREEVEDGVTLRLCEPGGCCVACTNHHRKREKTKTPPKIQFKKWRYPRLLEQAEPKEEAPDALDVPKMFELISTVSFPRGGKPQGRVTTLIDVATRKGFGTLHQAVGETGKRILHLKMGSHRQERHRARCEDVRRDEARGGRRRLGVARIDPLLRASPH